MPSPAGSVGASKLRLEVSTGHPHLHPPASNLANLRKPNGCPPIVGATTSTPEHSRIFAQIQRRIATRRGGCPHPPEHGWILHKPNGEAQPVGARIARPRNGQCPFPTCKSNLRCAMEDFAARASPRPTPAFTIWSLRSPENGQPQGLSLRCVVK